MPHVWEKKYTPLNTEHMGEGRGATGEGEAGNPRGGWAEPPASSEGGTASRGSLKKEENHTTEGEGPEGEGVVPFIHNIVNIHSLYYMCFSLVFACLSVRLSVWELDLGSLAPLLPAPTPLPHPGNRGWNRYGPQAWWEPADGAWASASILAPESYVRACTPARVSVCACMYMGNLCASMYKRRGSLSHRGWGQGGLLMAGPAWVASSQVDPS